MVAGAGGRWSSSSRWSLLITSPSKSQSRSPAVVVELLADQDVVQRLPQVLVHVGVVDVAGVAVLLQRLRRVEPDVGAAVTSPTRYCGCSVRMFTVLLCWPSLTSPSTITGVSCPSARGQQHPQRRRLGRPPDRRQRRAERGRVRLVEAAPRTTARRRCGSAASTSGGSRRPRSAAASSRSATWKRSTGRENPGMFTLIAGACRSEGLLVSSRIASGKSRSSPAPRAAGPCERAPRRRSGPRGRARPARRTRHRARRRVEDRGHRVAVPQLLQADDVGVERA